MSPHTTILFPRPSFIEGLGRIFDFAGILSIYNVSRNPSTADSKAMNADWAAVGDDMWTAVAQAEEDFKRRQRHQPDDEEAQETTGTT